MRETREKDRMSQSEKAKLKKTKCPPAEAIPTHEVINASASWRHM